MGHQRLGQLPRSRSWQQVVRLIADGATAGEVAAATSFAAESSLSEISSDPGLRQAIWLLTQIPLVARGTQFAQELRRLGLDVSGQPTLIEITASMVEAIDRHVSQAHQRTDTSEISQLCAAESLNAVAGRQAADLFGTDPTKVRLALRALGTPNQFAILARDFFSRVLRRHLDYFLSRELSRHVGREARFPSIREHVEFDAAIDLHCREASRILEEFAGQWFSKHTYEGGITEGKAANFARYAMRKVRDELRQGADTHA
jgi:hypothetical protein